jgi:hypothetical protein
MTAAKTGVTPVNIFALEAGNVWDVADDEDTSGLTLEVPEHTPRRKDVMRLS